MSIQGAIVQKVDSWIPSNVLFDFKARWVFSQLFCRLVRHECEQHLCSLPPVTVPTHGPLLVNRVFELKLRVQTLGHLRSQVRSSARETLIYDAE